MYSNSAWFGCCIYNILFILFRSTETLQNGVNHTLHRHKPQDSAGMILQENQMIKLSLSNQCHYLEAHSN